MHLKVGRHHWALWEEKTSLLGVKNGRIEFKLWTLVDERQFSNIYSVF